MNVSSFAWTLPIAASTLGLTRTTQIVNSAFFSRTWKPAIQMRILVIDTAIHVQLHEKVNHTNKENILFVGASCFFVLSLEVEQYLKSIIYCLNFGNNKL